MCCGELSAQALLAPPFGLQWGDAPDKVLDWAEAKKLDVVIKIPGDKPSVREIAVSSLKGSLPGHQARVLEARYHWGKLYEVALHYGVLGGDSVKLGKLFERLKSELTLKHGQFKANNKQVKKVDGFVSSSVSYHVEPVHGLMLLMVVTEVEDKLRKKKSVRFSLIYRNQNILPKKGE